MDLYVEEFKRRNRIFHDSEDDAILEQLEDSKQDIMSLIGSFDPERFRKGKELIFERTRYVRNEALEYFYDNFQQSI
ncbi:phage gp6-like head-tail connector protein, partial [Enterococcus faecium]|nr:phage gp6-like head-tail connector protein [Enterococcus faecium]